MYSESERLDILLRTLLRERPEYSNIQIPQSVTDKRNLLRALMNVRPPAPLSEETMKLQDEELAEQREEKGVVALDAIPASPVNPRLRLWQGE